MSSLGGKLVITVVQCESLEQTQWFGEQCPFVVVQYGEKRFRTNTSRDGGQEPKFNENIDFNLIEKIKKAIVEVWKVNTLPPNTCLGVGEIQLDNVLKNGYGEDLFSIRDAKGRKAGEVKLRMRITNNTRSVSPVEACHHEEYPLAPPVPYFPKDCEPTAPPMELNHKEYCHGGSSTPVSTAAPPPPPPPPPPPCPPMIASRPIDPFNGEYHPAVGAAPPSPPPLPPPPPPPPPPMAYYPARYYRFGEYPEDDPSQVPSTIGQYPYPYPYPQPRCQGMRPGDETYGGPSAVCTHD